MGRTGRSLRHSRFDLGSLSTPRRRRPVIDPDHEWCLRCLDWQSGRFATALSFTNRSFHHLQRIAGRDFLQLDSDTGTPFPCPVSTHEKTAGHRHLFPDLHRRSTVDQTTPLETIFGAGSPMGEVGP